MSADQQKPNFEPPPWEHDAFERFREAQNAQRAQAELDAALQTVRSAAEEAHRAASAAQSGVPGEADLPQAPQGERVAPGEGIPEAEVDSMIIQLRGEERPAQHAGSTLINGVIAFMSIFGAYIIIRSALLLGDVQTTSAAETMLAATLSFMVFATGLGFLGGAFLLFRKYHR